MKRRTFTTHGLEKVSVIAGDPQLESMRSNTEIHPHEDIQYTETPKPSKRKPDLDGYDSYGRKYTRTLATRIIHRTA